MSVRKATKFNPEWLNNPDYKAWLREVPGNCFAAKCLLRNTIVQLSNMGSRAKSSHSSSKKHQDIAMFRRTNRPVTHYTTENRPASINNGGNPAQNETTPSSLSSASNASEEFQRKKAGGNIDPHGFFPNLHQTFLSYI